MKRVTVKRVAAVFLFIVFLVGSTGCTWMFDSLVDSIFDRSEDSPRDGRDLDADGLTERDKRARFEEKYIRENFGSTDPFR